MKIFLVFIICIYSNIGKSKNVNIESFINTQLIELRGEHLFPISKCLIPDLGRFRFGEVTFIKDRNIGNGKTGEQEKCVDNLLHEIHFIKLPTNESNDEINYLLTKPNVTYLKNNWLNIYIVDNLDNRGDLSFHIFIMYPVDEYTLYIQGRIDSLNKKESYPQICSVLKRFLKINKSDKILKEFSKSVYCRDKAER